jgi:hypothetical protein
MKTGDRVTVIDPKSPWYRYSGWLIGDGEVYLNARPAQADRGAQGFPPVFSAEQLAVRD